MNFVSWSVTAALMASASPAFAAESAAEAGADAGQSSIVVTGQRDEYGVRRTSTATRTDTALRDIPQALTVISESQIEDQDLRSIADVLTFVPGAMPGTGEANRDQFTLRGNNTTADMFVDGLRDDVQYFRDLYNVERVEVLRGANAMIFGRGGGGGVVNRVIKRSSLNSYRQLSASGDNHGGSRFTGDLDLPLAPSLGLRINGMYENGESFRRHVELERYGVNPTLGVMAGPNTRFDAGYEYFRDRRTTDRGIPADGSRPLEGEDRTFFGDPDDSFAKAQVHIGRFGVEHQFGSALTLRNRTLVGDYSKFYQNIFPSNLDEVTRLVTLGAYNSRNDRRNLFSQTDLIWQTRLGGVDQTLLFGFEVGRQTSRNLRASGTFAPGTNVVPLTDPTVDLDVTFANNGGSDANNRTRADVAAIYVQDQIRLSSQLEIVAGLRLDRFKLTVNDLRLADADFARTDTMVSPRLGLIAKPRDNLSLYASYSRSYLPQSGDQFSGLTSSTDALKPERFDNFEVGTKWEPVEGLLATLAVYQLDRENTQSPNPITGAPPLLTGKQRSRGIELGLERSISDRWQVSAGYAYQKAQILERTNACNPDAARCEVPLVPRHQFSLWNRYDLNSTIGAGIGLVARSKVYASIGNGVTLPGYARIDGALFYKLGRGIEAQVNVENLLGTDYFSTAHSDNNIAPGAPRTVKATLRYGF